MSSAPPPPSTPGRKAPGSVEPSAAGKPSGKVERPRYLFLALVAALFFGAGCWTEGCSRIAFYRGEHDQAQLLNAAIRDEAERGRAEALYLRYTAVADAARGRAYPMAVAIFVLGAALLALAARGLAGKSNTRSALMQIVAAQAIACVASYYVTRDVRNAELDWEVERTLIQKRETLPADQYEQLVPMMHGFRTIGIPAWLVFRTVASALIVVALTRPRSREFFESAGGPVSER
ncbi:MAG: hypothetical protein KF819_19780 [Labilithrix sp.]|nr:hypothetical protein [Labilithrix sp.]